MDRLIIFARVPEEGRVKTRLAAKIGTSAALEAYRTLLRELFKNLSGLKAAQIYFTPATGDVTEFPAPPAGWAFRAQAEGDLGIRLARAFDEAFADGARAVVILGADCPEASTAHVREAWKSLREKDVVLGPAADGGYWLIGLRRAEPRLFQDIAWGSDQVFVQTIARAKERKLSIGLLEILEDVDTQEEWARFKARAKL